MWPNISYTAFNCSLKLRSQLSMVTFCKIDKSPSRYLSKSVSSAPGIIIFKRFLLASKITIVSIFCNIIKNILNIQQHI